MQFLKPYVRDKIQQYHIKNIILVGPNIHVSGLHCHALGIRPWPRPSVVDAFLMTSCS